MIKFFLFIILNVQVSFVAAKECEALIPREGISVNCEHPVTKKAINCYSGKLPEGTVANYACILVYYISLNDDIHHGKLTCSQRGQWIGRYQFNSFSCTVNCGIPLGKAVGFVIGGNQTQSPQWPWHASIFLRKNSQDAFSYKCGGTLMKPYSKGFVILTAAHCLADQIGKPRDTANVKILLGAEFSNLEENGDVEGVQTHNVREIVLHQSYEGASKDFQADIAMIALEEEVKLSHLVLPICFSGSVETTQRGAIGEVVGFGRYAYETETVSILLRKASLPIVNPDLCFEWRNRKLLPQELCAGYSNRESVCNGDSGGGYAFKVDANHAQRYYIQGIVSHGKRDEDQGKETCDSYSVFTKVTSYAKWIRDTADLLFQDHEDEREKQQQPSTEQITVPPATFPKLLPTPTINVPNLQRPIQNLPQSNSQNLYPTQPQDYERKSLERHNFYRRMHAAPNLRLNTKLKQRAQAYADKLIREGTFKNENEEGINKNIYYTTGSNVKTAEAAVAAVDSWYEDVVSYNWRSPYYSTFSQLVWKSTTDMGTGVASDGKRTVIVVAYAPPGNILGENGRFFRENVSPNV